MKVKLIFVLLLFSASAHAQTNSVQSKPFSNYTEYKGLIFVSGQIGNPDAGFNEEVHQAFRNVSEKLKQAGSSMKQVLSVTVYLRALRQIDEFNNIYRSYFQDPFPARTCVAVSDLVQHANVEISVIAHK
jgi:2-iminobutanoate/2-iminopropanoate deaminase